MKVSDRKIQANKINGLKGAAATKRNADERYLQNPKYCKHCNTMLPREKKQNTFCNRSCSASYNNTGIRRHGSPPSNCQQCGDTNSKATAKFCSQKCSGIAKRVDDEIKRAGNAAAQAACRAKHGYLRAYAHEADRDKIKEIYANRPEGYEVDHIIPLSKGGLHHEDNLQYLTVLENRQKSNKLSP